MIRRHEPTEGEWKLLAPLVPRAATGRPRVSDRQVINGMVYKIRTGISWRDLPERHGPWKTVYTRFRHYALNCAFTWALQQIQACADAAGDVETGSSRSTPPSSAPTSSAGRVRRWGFLVCGRLLGIGSWGPRWRCRHGCTAVFRGVQAVALVESTGRSINSGSMSLVA
ncbi:transposase [Streptomyces werraensis]|uniref:transposase n=1 Tax=Streptomyces werraensis TaxID=68284 RepID=UPI00382ACFFA